MTDSHVWLVFMERVDGSANWEYHLLRECAVASYSRAKEVREYKIVIISEVKEWFVL